jgi:hypothetical protein
MSSCCNSSLLFFIISWLLRIQKSTSFLLSLDHYRNNNQLSLLSCSFTQHQHIRISSLDKKRDGRSKNKRHGHTKLNLRNFDLPEALIFYGLDTVVDNILASSDSTIAININNNKPSVRPGVLRLMKESEEIKTPIIILSEHYTMDEISSILHDADETFQTLNEKNSLHYRSSLEEFIVDYNKIFQNNGDGNMENDNDEEFYDYAPTFQGKGIGHAPSPAALMDAIHTIWIEPRGFGGSAGFGTKYADAIRNPLPQHCVVFVSSSSDEHTRDRKQFADNYSGSGSGSGSNSSDGSYESISRDRAVASRTAGMRVMYIEDGRLGSCTAEDVSDGIVDSLGTEDDWSIVTMDCISTPGSFWLNMAQPRDENGNRVNAYEVIDRYTKLRTPARQNRGLKDEENVKEKENDPTDDVMDEDEIRKILEDLDSL